MINEAQEKIVDDRQVSTERRSSLKPHEYVLLRPVANQKVSKVHPKLLGPFEVQKEVTDRNCVTIKSLKDSKQQTIPLKRIVRFRHERYTMPELRQLAELDQEVYIVDQVLSHRVDADGMIWYMCKWVGYDEPSEEPESGVGHTPAVLAYKTLKDL
ncbi:hypothetical protein ADUPG1_011731 [Aduncisulcus paluster]|uniref:Chromo domain-containing protein n=1 Tax=Aduncisulcus paluster TaxID=2918883 RepID=A0ABQ5JX09_9EUKA|nr:hypothetical protein ADUPG1_011731 [Aduncisulcus paluster]